MNPEFRRHLWLELSPARLALTPALLGLGFGALRWSGQPWAADLVAYLAWWGFWLFAAAWGSRRAAASITDELAEGTWHGQRMSSLGAWPMTWGKLCGATIFPWYGAAICLGIHLAARLASLDGCSQAGCDAARAALLWQPLAMVALALAIQAAALAITLARHVQDPFATRLALTSSQGLALVLLALAWALIGNLPSVLTGAVSDLLRGIAAPAPPIRWYAWALPPAALAAAFLGLLSGGAVLASFRIMRVALLYRALPWGYAAVTAAAIGFLAGFPQALDLSMSRLGIAFTGPMGLFAAAIVAVYPALMFGRKDIVFLARLVAAIRDRRWRRAFELAPPWLAALLLALLFAVPAAEGPANLGLVLALLGFVLRDIGIAFWWQLNPASRRSDLATFVTLVAAYGLLPAVALAAGMHFLLALFLPAPIFGAGVTAAVALAEAIAIWLLVATRWRALRPAVSPA